MKNNNNKFSLNFLVPVGPTGPTGPTGKQGPVGAANLEELVFIQYNNSFNPGLLTIFSNYILPDNSTIFSINKNEVTINEPGNYEYTLCGKLNGNVTISIQSVDSNGTLVNLESINSITKSMLFSKTKILQVKSKQSIHILFFSNENNANVEPLKLLIKKLPF